MSEVAAERVLVVPTAVFHQLGHFQGFCADVDRYLTPLLESEQAGYRPRDEVEQDPGFKQLIPYVVFCHERPNGQLTVFQYRRGSGMGEGRLHRKRSVGIGGHISTVDRDADDQGNPYDEGLRRELEEEVVIETPYMAQCVGLINDDETEVGRVHLGVVHRFDVAKPAVRSREVDLIESGFRPVDELLADLSDFETWSQICLEAMFRR